MKIEPTWKKSANKKVEGEWTYSNGETMLNRDENDAEEGTEHHNKIELVDLPNGIGGGDVDEADNRGDDDGGQHQIGRVLKQRHQKQQCHHDRH